EEELEAIRARRLLEHVALAGHRVIRFVYDPEALETPCKLRDQRGLTGGVGAGNGDAHGTRDVLRAGRARRRGQRAKARRAASTIGTPMRNMCTNSPVTHTTVGGVGLGPIRESGITA